MVFSGRIILIVLAAACLAGVAGCSLSDSSQLDEENEPHYILGKSRVNALDYSAAIDAFNESLQVNPHSAAAHYQLACLFDSGKTNIADPAAAIYHYREFLKLNPQAENATVVGQRIEGCKRALAEDVNSLPSMPAAQKLLESLSETNHVLQAEVDRWRAYYAAQPTPASRSENTATQNNSPSRASDGGSPAVRNLSASRPAAPLAGTKTHLVTRGETLAGIARKTHVSLAALQAANPGINPKRLRVGQPVNLP